MEGHRMVSRTVGVPAFGQADLSNCEREQIHLPGSIQPHGALLLARLPDLIIERASANAAEFLGITRELIGRRLADLGGDLARVVGGLLDEPAHDVPLAVRGHVGAPARAFDLLLHRAPGGEGLVIELEPAGPPVDLGVHVESALQTVLGASSLLSLADEAARLFRDLTGYDRVMLYRFDDDGHGEVLSEHRRQGLESFLGNRYPASDIPRNARRLYERNRVRVLADIEYTPVPLRPPPAGADLDMSLCVLRSVSPIHVQYLRNMGVRATLVVSLMVGGRLWGLISCHHYEPRFVHFEIRAVCELLAEAIGTRIAALQSFSEGQAELSVRRLEKRMVEAISREGDWRAGLFDGSQSVLQALGAAGAALLYDGQCQTAGDVPGTQQLRELGAWLDTQPRVGVIATASLRVDAPQFGYLAPAVSGLVAVPVSRGPGEYLMWFRPERVRTITWGGDPFKPVQIGDNPADLSPRRSFAQWHQLVEGTTDPWSPADLAAARLIGETVTDVVLQFRAVRMLIAQDQLAQVTREVRMSGQPVIVADAGGGILLINDAFRRLLPPGRSPPARLEELLGLLSDAGELRVRLPDLLRQRRAWRGEVWLVSDDAEPKPLLARADPVFSAPDRVLGYVLLFTDLTERKAAEAARRRFQEGIVAGQRTMSGRLDSRSDLVFQNVLSALVENAQLAALEITDGVEMARLPAMLESVQASVSRAAEVLGHLIWHASRSGEDER
jgi:light-regulated signal transduction histidine kinase (bacteriophytochrome)